MAGWCRLRIAGCYGRREAARGYSQGSLSMDSVAEVSQEIPARK